MVVRMPLTPNPTSDNTFLFFIERCSSIPLLMNPLASSILYLCQHPQSILLPDETPCFLTRRGRRFHHPSLQVCALHVALTVLVGTAVTATIGCSQSAVAIVACVATLFTSVLGQHEIDPNQIHTSFWTALPLLVKRSVAVTVVVAGCLCATEYAARVSFKLIRHLPFSCGCMAFFVSAMDTLILHSFFCSQWESYIEDVSADPAAQLNIVLLGLLYNPAMVKNIQLQQYTTGQERELEQCRAWSQTLARSWLTPALGYRELPLEEDILRVAIIQSLQSTMWATDDTILLVRALCVYARALGESIVLATSSSSNRETWFVPAGMLACGAYAVTAITRFVVTQTTRMDWRSSPVSPLVPACLDAIHYLGQGLHKYDNRRMLSRICDASAKRILETLRRNNSMERNRHRLFDIEQEENSRLWIEGLYDN
jgi:hypothetical protein